MDYSSASAHAGSRSTIPSQSTNVQGYQAVQTNARPTAGQTQQQQSAAAVQHNATLPPMDPQAFGLAIWSQLQAQMQSGLVPPPPFALPFIGSNGLPVPPPPPPPIMPAAAPAQAAQMLSSPSPFYAQTQRQQQTSQLSLPRGGPLMNNRIAEIVDADKEEGEVSDGEASRSPASQQGKPSNVTGSNVSDRPSQQRANSGGRVYRRDSDRREFSSTGRGYDQYIPDQRHEQARSDRGARSLPRRNSSLREHRNVSPVSQSGGLSSHYANERVERPEPARANGSSNMRRRSSGERYANNPPTKSVSSSGLQTDLPASMTADERPSTVQSPISKALESLEQLLSHSGVSSTNNAQVKHSEEGVRKAVKNFISALQEGNIGFSDLAQERDLDLSDVQLQFLRKLYAEAKLPSMIPPSKTTRHVENDLPPPVSARENRTSSSTTEVPVTKDTAIVPSLGKSSKPQQSPAPAVALQTAATAIDSPALKPPAPPLPTAKAAPAPGRPATTANKPPMDRQEYLARLLAAKSGKSAPGTKAAAQSNASTPPIEEPKAQAEPVAQQASSAMPGQEEQLSSNDAVASQKTVVEPLPSPAPASLQSDALAVQKKKAQTELARRRMEELAAKKRSAANSAVSANSLPSGSVSLPTDSVLSVSSPAATAVAVAVTESTSVSELSYASTPSTEAAANPSTAVHAPPPAPPIPSPDPVQRAVPQFGKPSSPGIPGLFMANSAPPPAPASQQTNGAFAISDTNPVIATKGRKRPVASDFDDLEPVSSLAAAKRPFGQDRFQQADEALIIEASDDETVESTMDLDDQEGIPGLMATTTPMIITVPAVGSTTKESNLRNLGPLADFPPKQPPIVRPGSSVPTSAVNTPSADPEHVKRKEEEIAAMKKKIAELEQRRKAKVLASSRGQTPGTPIPAATVPSMPSKPPARLDEQASSIPALLPEPTTGTLANVPPEPILAPQDRQVTPTAAVTQERTTFLDLSAPAVATPDWRERRRAEIQSGQAALDADIASKRARYEQLKREMERYEQMKREMEQLEADTQREERDKEKLLEELRALDVDTDGLSHQELQAKKDEIIQRREEAAASVSLIDSQETRLSTSGVPSVATEDAAGELLAVNGATPLRVTEAPEVSTVEAPARKVEDNRVSEAQLVNSDALDDAMDMSSESDEGEASVKTDLPTQVSQAVSRSPSTERSYSPDFEVLSADPSGPSDEEMADAGVPVAVTSDSEGEIVEQQAAAEPSINAPRSVERSGSVSQEEGEMDTESDASSEMGEYEPPDIITAEPRDDSTLVSSDDDFYEPTDAPPAAAPSTDPILPQISAPAISASISASDTNTPDIAIADDLASELQPDQQVQEPVAEPGPSNSHLTKQKYFAPYESALKSFKAYRYHPQYSQDVSGGFRSMTYSHQIDAEKPLCKYEAAGGVCNDRQCQDQHFRSMQLSDDKILVQLGTTNPGRTPEEKHQWTEGLKLVLKDLRQLNTRDPDVVATAIANYRREYLQDPSRVLNI